MTQTELEKQQDALDVLHNNIDIELCHSRRHCEIDSEQYVKDILSYVANYCGPLYYSERVLDSTGIEMKL